MNLSQVIEQITLLIIVQGANSAICLALVERLKMSLNSTKTINIWNFYKLTIFQNQPKK